jgi:hypothetical protein
MNAQRTVAVRSYRDVVDVVERRIFRIDRWRIPSPGGVSAAAIGYFAATLVAVLVLSRLPLIGELLSSLQPALRLIGIPVLCAWALVSWQVDGRRPHHALWAWCRSRVAPRTLAGLGRAPAVGSEFAPVEGVTIAPSGDEPRYRAGRVQGPAIVLLRYPARLAVDGRGVGAAESLAERLVRAKRVRVAALDEAALPLVDAQAIRIPEGAEVVFE